MVLVAVKSGMDSETLNQLKKIGIRHGVDLEEDGLGVGQHGVGGDILEEHLSELTGGVVHYVRNRCWSRSRTPPAESRVSDRALARP